MEDSKNHQNFCQTKKKIRHLTVFARKKKGLMSPIVQLSYADKNKHLPLPTAINPSIKKVF